MEHTPQTIEAQGAKTMNFTVYYENERIPIMEALVQMSDDWIEDGKYCDRTIMDLRDALLCILAKPKQRRGRAK